MKNPVVPSLLFLAICQVASAAGPSDALVSVDYQKLVSSADLAYTNAVSRSEDGMPIGNGRMGTLVWTTPSAIRFQINRVDVFGNNSASDSFNERNSDYCGGCGFVDVNFADYGNDVFPPARTKQHLSCYDGLATVDGDRVHAETLAWNKEDVIAIRVADHRGRPGTITINLRMLRPPVVHTANQTATSKLDSHNGKILLTQDFAEGDYYCGSAVAIAVSGRDAEVRLENNQEIRLVTKPGRGAFTVYVSSAASFKDDGKTAAAALAQLDDAAAPGFDGMLKSNRSWWRDFWSKSFIHLHSADGVADAMEQDYNYYLYLMASTSRGKYPTKFNGMLWNTAGDERRWGGNFWGANQSCLYNNALCAADHIELLDPMFDMISGMLDSCALAARQQWGSQGVFIPETVAFDGLAPLPDDIAAEMRDLYLLRKPWDQRSRAFMDYAATKLPYSSRWNWVGPGRFEAGRWVTTDRGGGPYGPVTHTFARGAKIAYQYWVRYEYTQDQDWLRNRAYPVIKGIAEFYRNYPNVKKEADGKYHINRVNSNEGVWGARDTDEEIAGIMGITPVAIKASEILNVDADLRPLWQEFLSNLAPLPRSDDPDAPPSRITNRAPVWIRGLNPIVHGPGAGRPDGNTMPVWFFDLCTLESGPAMWNIGSNTFAMYAGNYPGSTNRRMSVLSKVPLVAAIMGRTDMVRTLIPNQFFRCEIPPLANRMDLREGPQTTSAQRLGNAADALHTALCQDLPAGPAQPSVIRVFPAWPREWDAEYSLLCRGGFFVSSTMQNGEIKFVQLDSRLGGDCRLRNPWPEGDVTLYRNGSKAEDLSGPLLQFATTKGERIVAVRAGTKPEKLR
jgi:hypothetical protein